MSKIKVLHIIKSLGRGGAEMLLPETLKLHNQSDFEFHYIYFLPWKNQMVESIETAGGKVTCFAANNNIQLLLQFQRIIQYCKTYEINLIHCHLPWAGFVGRIVHKLSKIPVLYTEHNMQERYHPLTKAINKFTFNSQTQSFGVSDDVTKSIRENIKPNIDVRTLLNGVNTSSFVATKSSNIRYSLDLPENAFVIGNVAVFRFQKRLVEWLRVIKKIREKHTNVYGIIVGDGPLDKEIKKACLDLQLQEYVFFPGLKTEVKPYLEVMDVFMMTSSFEGLPIALLEAMSMECAIVSTNAGGIKEVIRDEIDGLTCEVNEWEKLALKNDHLINNPEKLKLMQAAARERVLKSFSLKKMVSKLEEYYIKANR